MRWACIASPNGIFCGAVFRAREWREEEVYNGNVGKKRAWYCRACESRQKPFARGKSVIVDILHTDTGKWHTCLSNPPPDPIFAAVTLLKYDSYKALIDEWGPLAREHLPEIRQIGPTQPSPHCPGHSFRIESFSSLEELKQLDWWMMAGLAVGWSPEKTKEFQLSHSDKAMAKLLAQAAEETAPARINQQVQDAVGQERVAADGDAHMIISNDSMVRTCECLFCNLSFPADSDNWSKYWMAIFKKQLKEVSIPAGEKPQCKDCQKKAKKGGGSSYIKSDPCAMVK